MPPNNNAMMKKVVERAIAKKGDGPINLENAMGTVEGWRAWQVPRKFDYQNPPVLGSVTHNYIWTPRERARAYCPTCSSTDPEKSNCTPGNNCGCGFYTAKTLAHLRTMSYHTYDEESDLVTVVGRVALWGKVIEGSQGWRAEFAYPIALYCPFEVWKIARPLQQAYGVPVKLLNLLDDDAKPEKARKLPMPVQKKEPPKYLQDYREKHEGDD